MEVVDKPVCKLTGEDGNVFNVIGVVSKCLKANGFRDEGNEFTSRAFTCSSYDEVLRLAATYVEVK